MKNRTNIIGVPISILNLTDTIQEIHSNMYIAKQSYICVANVHTTVMAKENSEYFAVQANSFLTLPDGKPLSVLGRKNGAENMQQVRGVDFMTALFTDCENNNYKHYFYGNTKENLYILIERLQKEHPMLKIVGYQPSIFRDLSDDELEMLTQDIKTTKADFLWVAIGAPRQEIFCERIKGKTGAVPVGVGGAFNVLAHIVHDAPNWMKKCGLEWFYRFCKEPKRLFKRYFTTNIKFLFYLFFERGTKQ